MFILYCDQQNFFHPLRANPTKWSNTLKQFVGNYRRIECLTILWGWRLKGLEFHGKILFRYLHGQSQ